MTTQSLQTQSEDTPTVTMREGITARIESESPVLEAAATHLLAASGKGYRPICVRMTGEAFSPSGRIDEGHERVAEAIEFVHVGSLIHDDILDEADTRRGVRCVHVGWDQKVAVLAGDYLLAQASSRIASLNDPYLSRRLAEMIVDLCEGELLQDEQCRQLDVTLDMYLTRIAKKTASPFEFACEAGARVSGADKRQCAVARRFGFHLGRLFQLVDDLLDWNADEQTLGKPAGRDLVAGVLTLPVHLALQSEVTGVALRAALTPFPATLTDEVRALVTHPVPYGETLAVVAEEAERARRWLAEFPPSSARTTLQGMLEALIQRAGLPEVV